MTDTSQTKRTKASRYNLRRPTEEEKADLEPQPRSTLDQDEAPQTPPAAAGEQDRASEAAVAESQSSAPAPTPTDSQQPASTSTKPQTAQRGKRGKDRSRRLEGLLAEVPYQLADEYPGKKRKKVWGLICPSLDEDLDEAHDLWNMLNPKWRTTHGGGAPPTKAAFREAVLRLGLKHLNDDPEFADLIPRDQRRTPGRDAELEVDE